MTRTPRTFGELTEDSLAQVGAPDPEPVQDRSEQPRSGPAAAGDHPVQLNVRLDADSRDRLDQAYLADYDTPNGPTSLGGWVGRAIEQHAALSPTRRAQLARNLPEQGPGVKVRGYRIPETVWPQLDAACTADRKAGRRVGRTSFAQEAIAAALQRTRGRN